MANKRKWPKLRRPEGAKEHPKVTVAEAKKMGINPVELISDPGYVLLGPDGKPRPLEWFEYNGD